MPTNCTIAILMATYNGERFLAEQIESILAQTYKNWHLFVHDDGSTDGTMAILTDYATRYREQITILDYPPQGGACRNFLSLLERVEAPYYMFSDQDDVWHDNKVERSIEKMQKIEIENKSKPIITHSDLHIVDQELQEIAPSFFAYTNIKPALQTCYGDCVRNYVTGCTMLLNQQAKVSALQRPMTAATMHDAWILLRTIADGGIKHTIYEPLIEYRQHGGNELGAFDASKITPLYRIQNAISMLKLNIKHYQMMKAAGHITLLQYIKFKIKMMRYD